MSEDTSVGGAIGPYRVVAPLEDGGMASLYLAHRPPARDIVAVKVIRTRLRDDSAMVRMFQDEARTLTHVRHPNVVRVLDSGEYEHGRYLAMEYLHGCSLARLRDELERREVPLPVDVVAHVGIEVAEALHAAHGALDADGKALGIVHRDVSPQNVMISENGNVKLIDFGVAKAHGRLEVTNARTMVKGKLRYMAPEQVSGKPVDGRTDIFALGIVLWECLTGRKFAARDGEGDLFARLMDPRATPPSEDNPDVPAALDDVVLAALAREPKDRPATARELAERIAAAADVSRGRDQLRALVDRMFGIELAYTRRWITDSFHLPEDEWHLEPPAAGDPGTTTRAMGREVLAALAARKVAEERRDASLAETLVAEEADGRPDPTRRERRRGGGRRGKLDLTFSLAKPRGLDATGARPLAAPFDEPVTLPDTGPDAEPFDAGNDTDNLAMRCLASLRQATWAELPAGAPPPLSLIASLEEITPDALPPPSSRPPPPAAPASRGWVLLVAVAVIVLMASLGITLIVLTSG
ncbi:MAG: serine/threonine protein kinase [Sandaracinaceae bacterium]|nr:serine/threonine protein kinase [Sandaracinaceae bacterium]